jgi:beta-glucanase (GH16 family)
MIRLFPAAMVGLRNVPAQMKKPAHSRVKTSMPMGTLSLAALFLAAGVLCGNVCNAQAPGTTTGTKDFDPKSIKQWSRKGELGNTPRRASERLPLSDQENKRAWVEVEGLWDEFDRPALDTNKWIIGMSWWRGRQPAWFNPTNVSVSRGRLHLSMRKEPVPAEMEKHGYRDYTSAALHTRARAGYGYYEVKARPMNSGGSSSFWFQQEDRAKHPGWSTEIDVFELCGKSAKYERKYNMNAHVFSTPQQKRHWSVGGEWDAAWRFVDDFHVFGFEWTADELRWFVDGVLVRTVRNTHWHQPLFLIFDSETMPEWFGMPADADLPSTFSIEYVRAWRVNGASGE